MHSFELDNYRIVNFGKNNKLGLYCGYDNRY